MKKFSKFTKDSQYQKIVKKLFSKISNSLSKRRAILVGMILFGIIGVSLIKNFTKVEATSTVPVSGYATVLATGEKLDFRSSEGATVTIDNYTRIMEGYAWSEDVGWVNFGANNNIDGPVRADKAGKVGLKASSLNAGSIDFGGSGSTVQVSSGAFSGYAWSEDLGWIDFSTVTAVGYIPDLTAPSNGSNLTLKKVNNGMSVTSGGWTNSNGYFAWSPATDNPGGSGVLGYCLYLGQDNNADPAVTKGLLGTSLTDTEAACPFAVASPEIDLNIVGRLASQLTTSNLPYYFKIKAIDNSTNIFGGTPESFSFKYDNVSPTNPSFINAPSQFLATKNVTIYWPSSGNDAPNDDTAGVKGLQYKIGNGPWYGKNHTGAGDITDLLDNNGSYVTVDPEDYSQLNEGNNIVSFRTYDEAGNISNDLITTVIKINTGAPSAPRNLSATPVSSSQNLFSFSWQEPSSFEGNVGSLVYCYTVNVLPTASNCVWTTPGQTSLPSGAYATQPGVNTMFVLAKDEAGNVNYGVNESIQFTANTSAPGVPLSVDIADISVKVSASWKLAVSWEKPSQEGSGIDKYKIWRSTDGSSYSEIASTKGTSLVDTDLSQIKYYYKVQACDSANNCGAMSGVVEKIPNGRFTEPAKLSGSPSATVKTRSVKIAWTTDRTSDSRVQYGTKTGEYFSSEFAQSAQVKNHTIELNNLQPDTTYFYKARWTDEDGNIGASSELVFKTLPAPTIKDVSLEQVNLDSAIVKLTSNQASRVKLYYGISDSFGGLNEVNTATSESSYTVQLQGLVDGTKYHYKINPVDSEGNEYDSGRIESFETPAKPRIFNVQFQPVENAPSSTQKVTWHTNVLATTLISYSTNGQPPKELSDSKLVKDHNIIIEGLYDDSDYMVIAQSRDGYGNLASSDEQHFKTALDTRPPKVIKLRVETSVRGIGNEARGQMIVSWTTDEPASSQVAYGKGSSGSSYSFSTAEDNALTTEHTVVISDLDTSQVYHLKAVSFDKAHNQGSSDDRSAIINQPSDSVIDIILGTLEKIFGL